MASAEPVGSAQVTLHIGTGKTGTTTIQHCLDASRELLADRGWLYPSSPGRFRHTRLSLWAKTDEQLELDPAFHTQNTTDPAQLRRRFRRRFDREIEESGLSRVLLSDEGLYGMPDDAIARLRPFVARRAASVRIVVYLRRQDDHLASRYQQTVKQGRVHRLSAWAATDMTRTYDYRARLDLWQRTWRPDLFVVRRFERGRFRNGSLLDDFLEAAGVDVPAADLTLPEQRNQSLDAESVEFLRLVNLHRHENDGLPEARIDNRWLLPTLMEHAHGPALTLPPADLRAFMARWQESNRAVARDFLGEPEGELFEQSGGSRETTVEQRLDPGRLDHFMDLVDLPEAWRAPLRRIAEREAVRTA